MRAEQTVSAPREGLGPRCPITFRSFQIPGLTAGTCFRAKTMEGVNVCCFTKNLGQVSVMLRPLEMSGFEEKWRCSGEGSVLL